MKIRTSFVSNSSSSSFVVLLIYRGDVNSLVQSFLKPSRVSTPIKHEVLDYIHNAEKEDLVELLSSSKKNIIAQNKFMTELDYSIKSFDIPVYHIRRLKLLFEIYSEYKGLSEIGFDKFTGFSSSSESIREIFPKFKMLPNLRIEVKE